MKKVAAVGVALAIVGLACFVVRSRQYSFGEPQARLVALHLSGGASPLKPLDAGGYVGVKEIARPELEAFMSSARPLSQDEKANLDRGCLGLVCIYQGLGITRWPESASATRSYLRLDDALKRRCGDGRENFVFVKQAWWTDGKPPQPDALSGAVPLDCVTRLMPGKYTFNYAAYFPTTRTFAWINHREYGFPMNLFKPQKAYLSTSPPPLDDGRTAQIYCSTCR